MLYRNLGKSGIKVSEISLGTWMTDLTGSAQEDEAKKIVKLAYESGINFFDCAAKGLPNFLPLALILSKDAFVRCDIRFRSISADKPNANAITLL